MKRWHIAGLFAAVLASACSQGKDASAQATRDRETLPKPVYRVAAQPDHADPPVGATGEAPAEHPLEPALRVAQAVSDNIKNNVKDYTATMVKRERVAGKLGEHEYMFLKVRQEPFAVYMYFLGPDRVKGQECIYYPSKNNGNMLAHGVGLQKMVGTVSLDPKGTLAMKGQRYPITDIGIAHLTKRLIEVAENDKQYGECEVKFFRGAKINGRVCTCIQVTHPTPRKNFLFNVAKVFVDDELNVPIRFEAYDWPAAAGENPQLLEEYTYLNLKLNNGLGDGDFDTKNPNYGF